MIRKYVFICATLSIFFAGCKKAEKITPTEEFESQYTVPQGNHDYDNDIVELYNRYDVYFLYKFNIKDFYWTQTTLGGSENNPQIFKTYFFAEAADKPADENYIKPVISFLKDNWLNYYPEVFLKSYLTRRLLLADNLNALSASPTKGPINAVAGFNQITIGNVSPVFATLTAAQKLKFKADLHASLWMSFYRQPRLELPAEFFASSDYITSFTTAKQSERGFLSSLGGAYATLPWLWDKPQVDFIDYMKAITATPKATLENTILKSTTDVNGLIRKKYNILIKFYMDKYGVDLQKIGDSPVIN